MGPHIYGRCLTPKMVGLSTPPKKEVDRWIPRVYTDISFHVFLLTFFVPLRMQIYILRNI